MLVLTLSLVAQLPQYLCVLELSQVGGDDIGSLTALKSAKPASMDHLEETLEKSGTSVGKGTALPPGNRGTPSFTLNQACSGSRAGAHRESRQGAIPRQMSWLKEKVLENVP